MSSDVTFVDAAALDALVDPFPDDGPGIRFLDHDAVTPADAQRFSTTFGYLWEMARQEPSPLVSGAATRLMLTTLLDVCPNTHGPEPTSSDSRDAHPEVLKRAIAWIDSHASEDFSIADVARAARVGVQAVQLAFRRHLDMSAGQYVRRIRLHHAHDELAASDADTVSVAEVAKRWGFADVEQFVMQHRMVFGEDPQCILER